MTDRTAIIALFALAASGPAVGTASAAAPPAAGSIAADVGISEWGPPGKLRLNLGTGRYRLRTAPPRPGSPVSGVRQVGGRLSRARLEQVRTAFAAALSEGLVEAACAAGGTPPRLVLMNAATPVMVLTGERATLTASGELGCWTQAAWTLHNLLETIFASQARPGG